MQDLKPNPQDTAVFYLENIYQLLANTNVSSGAIPSTLVKPPSFSPPRYVIWVNALWFLSLAFCLRGAIISTLFQQWIHRYLTVTQQQGHTPDQKARIRAIFANRAQGPYFTWGNGSSPLNLHFSFFLFITGGLIYLFNIDLVAFFSVVLGILVFTLVYALHSVAAAFQPDNLFYTPFSELVFIAYVCILDLWPQVRIPPPNVLPCPLVGYLEAWP